jgi:hypothetical protein
MKLGITLAVLLCLASLTLCAQTPDAQTSTTTSVNGDGGGTISALSPAAAERDEAKEKAAVKHALE